MMMTLKIKTVLALVALTIAGPALTSDAQAKPLKVYILITYLDELSWSQDRLLVGRNGIAALTFCNVPISECRKLK